MRLSSLAVLVWLFVTCVLSIRPAAAARAPDPVLAPSYEPLPLRGVIFVDVAWRASPRIAWLVGHGRTAVRAVSPTLLRIDYAAERSSVLDVAGTAFTLQPDAPPASAPRLESLYVMDPWKPARAREPRCQRIVIGLATRVAALRVRLTRGEHVEDYWLTSATGSYDLEPTCDAADAAQVAMVQLTAVTNRGVEITFTPPLDVRAGWAAHRASVAEFVAARELRAIGRAFGLLVLATFALVGARLASPAVALHGRTHRDDRRRGGRGLPRARVVRS